jgi:endonuclease III related protein
MSAPPWKPPMYANIEQVYSRLQSHYRAPFMAQFVKAPSADAETGALASSALGPRRDQPAAPTFEVLLNALLSQNGKLENTERALGNLREAGLFEARALVEAPPEELADLIQPAGAARQKSARLQKVLRYLIDRHGGSLEAMFATDHETLRRELSAINGIGRETAATILLEAAGVPIFVVDIHAHRVFKRHGWIEFEADSDAIRGLCESGPLQGAAALGEFRALLARVGRDHCGKTPLCDGCPLEDLLPKGGPLEAMP